MLPALLGYAVLASVVKTISTYTENKKYLEYYVDK
jgi:hypothetical protein